MPGINQIQVKPQIDLTFANALRSIVRQDPDVIMIGEIRDLETAQIAVQSALTGHLVLSTLHTNDAPATVTRLLDMGVEDYLLTSTVDRHPGAAPGAHALPALPRAVHGAARDRRRRWASTRFAADGGEITLWHAEGLHRAARRPATSGRIGIIEIMPMTDPLRSLIMRHATSAELRAQAVAEGMLTMYEDGLRKAVRGVTTFEEVLRVTRESSWLDRCRATACPSTATRPSTRPATSPPASSRPPTKPRSSTACATRA